MPNSQFSTLSVSGLTISFDVERPFTAVNDLSFRIEKGRTLAIVGESGSGKSLTALALMGLLPSTAEAAITNGRFLDADLRLTTHDLRLHAGMIFQEPMSSLNPVMRVGKQIREAILVHQDISNDGAKQLAIAWLDKVRMPEPKKMYDRYPHQLSGGQKQRVMIAMAMCNHPALLIADEPTTALDATVQQEIVRLMQYLQQEHGSAMIFITHDLALATTIADDVLVMHKGKMVEYGPAEQVLKHPQQAYTKALLACRPSPQQKGYRLPVVADFINGQTPVSPAAYSTTVVGAPLMEVKNLGVWFTNSKSGYLKVVDDISFVLNKGETLGLVGESGCGKSTLGRSLVGLIPANAGQILFNGTDLAALPIKRWSDVRPHIQMVFQDPYSSLNPRMTVGDALMEPLMVHSIVPKNELKKEALRLLELVQLPADSLNRYPHQFSGGQRQRIGIARALALRPELLICDESVSALDVSIQAQILNLLKDLQRELQLTYLFISHDLAVVHYISDRVMVMQAGKIVESGEAGQVLKQPKDEYTKRLVAAVV
jgi:peptide/nickel transport system ATP-binding protein